MRALGILLLSLFLGAPALSAPTPVVLKMEIQVGSQPVNQSSIKILMGSGSSFDFTHSKEQKFEISLLPTATLVGATEAVKLELLIVELYRGQRRVLVSSATSVFNHEEKLLQMKSQSGQNIRFKIIPNVIPSS